jgi:antitoxin (DNA-binding transcriptional repressor) of toxin-antitoxin stability system
VRNHQPVRRENEPLQARRPCRAGEEIIIAKAGKPKAKLVPYEAPRKRRIGGQNFLGITYMADDWDGPLPPEIQRYFDGERDDEDLV